MNKIIKQIKDRAVKPAWLYFLLSIAIIAIHLAILTTSFTTKVDLSIVTHDIITSLSNHYPDDLVVDYGEEGISINQPLPYAIPFEGIDSQYAWLSNIGDEINEENVINLVTFVDEQGMTPLSKYNEYQSIAVATPHEIYAPDDNDGLKGYSFEEMIRNKEDGTYESGTISKETINKIPLETITSFKPIQPNFYVPFTATLVLIGYLIFGTILNFLEILIASVLLLVGLNIFSKNNLEKFNKILTTGIYSFVPFILLKTILNQISDLHILDGILGFTIFLVWFIFVFIKTKTTTPIIPQPKDSSEEKAQQSL